MKVVVASQSEIKLNAVKTALIGFGIQAEVIGVKAKSAVAEQPFGEETLIGAKNRVADAQTLHPDADIYIAIENGTFQLNEDHFIDKAIIVCISKDGKETIGESATMEFPKKYFDEAKQRGFDKVTIGKVMAEDGFITKHDDPHLSILGKSRSAILTEALEEILCKNFKWTKSLQKSKQPDRIIT